MKRNLKEAYAFLISLVAFVSGALVVVFLTGWFFSDFASHKAIFISAVFFVVSAILVILNPRARSWFVSNFSLLSQL